MTVADLATLVGATVVVERWPLVTNGECDCRRRRLVVNAAALDAAEASGGPEARRRRFDVIVAHELAHLLWYDVRRTLGPGDPARDLEEAWAHAFAAGLVAHTSEPPSSASA